MLRLKRGSGFTFRSLFSRRTKGRDKRSSRRSSIPIPAAAETGLAYNRPAPTTANTTPKTAPTTASTSRRTVTPSKANLPLEKELEILGLQTDPRTTASSPPIDIRLATLRAPPLPYGRERACMLNQTTSSGPIVILPSMQDARARTLSDISGGRNAAATVTGVASRATRDTLMPPSPLLPPTPSLPFTPPATSLLPHSYLPQPTPPPISPSPSRLTSTTRSSGVLPWGLEAYTQDEVPIEDSLSEDHVLVLPSPPSVARFSARVS